VFGRAITFLKRILCHISNNSPLELQIALLKNGIESVRRIFLRKHWRTTTARLQEILDYTINFHYFGTLLENLEPH